jgi:uncharacterized protein
VEQLAVIQTPLITCESVVSEASYLLRTHTRGNEALIGLFRRGVAEVRFDIQREMTAVDRLLRRYANVPMSVADGCLVRMSEIHGSSTILTLDSDFRIYRKHGRQKIPLLAPEAH